VSDPGFYLLMLLIFAYLCLSGIRACVFLDKMRELDVNKANYHINDVSQPAYQGNNPSSGICTGNNSEAYGQNSQPTPQYPLDALAIIMALCAHKLETIIRRTNKAVNQKRTF
jgi:hypothetical protein